MAEQRGRTPVSWLAPLAVLVAVLVAVVTGCVVVTEPPGGGPPEDGRSPGGGGSGAHEPSSDGYTFIKVRKNGEPVRWSSCEPIRYVVREKHEPEGGRRILRESLRRISDASGLEFSFEGTTREAPSAKRPAYQPKRYGDGWAPVLVAYSNPREYRRLQGRAAGFGGPVFVRQSGAAPRFVSGAAVFDVEQISELGEDGMRGVMLHELAHVVGLGHVDDRGQLMNPVQYGRGVTELQEGDLAGLRVLGQGRCHEPLEPRRLGPRGR